MQLIEQMGIFPDRRIRERRPALRSVVKAVIATIRMRKFGEQWAVSKELRNSVARSLEVVRKENANSGAATNTAARRSPRTTLRVV